MICLETYRKQNPFFLAPMAGVTDKPFRSFMREMGCGIITSELISARALMDNNQRTRQLMAFNEDQRPYGIQIFGEDPYIIAEGAKRAEGFGADFIDLNLGCPVSKIVKKGAGSALLKDLNALSKILKSLKASVKIPVSLKVRTGWDEQSLNADQAARLAFKEGFAWMSIHGRTRAQAYSGKANWDYIKEVKAQSALPVVGNGDLISGPMAFEALRFSGCDGVMIGRGCLNDPWIFLEALNLFKQDKGAQQEDENRSKKELAQQEGESRQIKEAKNLAEAENQPHYTGRAQGRLSHRDNGFSDQNKVCQLKNNELAYIKAQGLNQKRCKTDETHFINFKMGDSSKKDFKQAIARLETHLESFYDERMFLLQLKKFSAWLSSGFPHSTEFRKSLFQEKDKQALREKIDEFFTQAQGHKKPAPVYEPFLMRGHG